MAVMWKVYFQKRGDWQHAHTFRNSVKGKIQAHNAAKRIQREGYKTKVTHKDREFI